MPLAKEFRGYFQGQWFSSPFLGDSVNHKQHCILGVTGYFNRGCMYVGLVIYVINKLCCCVIARLLIRFGSRVPQKIV